MLRQGGLQIRRGDLDRRWKVLRPRLEEGRRLEGRLAEGRRRLRVLVGVGRRALNLVEDALEVRRALLELGALLIGLARELPPL